MKGEEKMRMMTVKCPASPNKKMFQHKSRFLLYISMPMPQFEDEANS
jgi:hypothetical protein